MIPKILHQVQLTDAPIKSPELRLSFMKQNPEWSFILWNKERLPMIDNRYGMLHNFDVLEIALDESIPYVLRGDLIRFVVCFIYGGVYSDLDVKCQKPLDSLLDCNSFTGEGYCEQYCNSLIGCAAGNPLFLETSLAILKNIRENKHCPTHCIPKIGGVEFQAQFLKKCEKIYPLRYFNPFSWNDIAGRKKDWPDSYTVHYWYGMDSDGWINKPFH